MKFKQYILSEQKEYFADKVNNILTGIHELLKSEKQMSAKHMLRNAESVANQIRRVLHASWSRSEHKYLKTLQKCGCALMKTIEDKGDLTDTFNSVRTELENMTHKLGVPTNKLGSTEQQAPKQPAPPPPGAQPPAQPQQAPPQAAQPGPHAPQAPEQMQ
jgi:hypothetical protein